MTIDRWIALIAAFTALLIPVFGFLRGRIADRQKDRELEGTETSAAQEAKLRREQRVDEVSDSLLGRLDQQVRGLETRLAAVEQELREVRESDRAKSLTIERMRSAVRAWFTELRVWDRSGRSGQMPIPPDEDMHLLDLTLPTPL